MSLKKNLGGRFDPHAMRVRFPALWARYLRDRYGGRPAAIAAAFGVSEQTAYNWLDGKGRATGDKVALVAAADPEGLARALRRAAA